MPLRVFTRRDEVARKKQMTEKDKFKRAQNVLGRISSELTELTDDRFERAIGNLEAWWDGLRQGKTDVATEDAADDGSQVEPTQVGSNAEEGEEEKDGIIHGGSPQTEPLKMKPFNARAPKVGRPRLVRVDADNKRHAEQKSYNQGKTLRKAVRGEDVMEVAQYIRTHKPGLEQLHSFLDTFEVRFTRHTKKKMTVQSRPPDAANTLTFRLPQTLVTKALEEIRKTSGSTVVDLACSQTDTDVQWVVTIEGAGEFSEQQLKATYYLGDLAKLGLQCYSWLMTSVDPLLEERCRAAGGTVCGETEAYAVAKELMKTWPHTQLPGFDFPIEWSNIYCAREETWYNDLVIEAFTTTLSAKYGKNKTIFLPQLQLPDTNEGNRVPEATRAALEMATEDYIFLPINLNSSHWACIVVDNVKGALMCYDSVDKRTHLKLLQAIANEIISTTLTGFAQTTMHSPTQKDSDSCGLFVCLFFWKRLWKEAGSDYTHMGLRLRRWKVLHAIIEFSKGQGA
ncbi:hypothetical protein PR002_g17300 [Phytophthora rubi]|uniref:Ubiquitin-like protease family profile domain-containing protein n=1 Tax=Phytophthora rubi TaxID=129364 RepID=A0A6A3KD38_9STRA|nr:hypothetical protein PR002_g17300 [Phytophthora rubi]